MILERDPGCLRLSQGASLKTGESEVCSPVGGGRAIRLCSSWPSDDPPTPLRPEVDTGAGNRGEASAEFAMVAETVGCPDLSHQLTHLSHIFTRSNGCSTTPNRLSLPAHQDPGAVAGIDAAVAIIATERFFKLLKKLVLQSDRCKYPV